MCNKRQEQAVTESSVLKQSGYVYLALWYLSPEQAEVGRALSCPSPTRTSDCLQYALLHGSGACRTPHLQAHRQENR